jgi:hypothetical protein
MDPDRTSAPSRRRGPRTRRGELSKRTSNHSPGPRLKAITRVSHPPGGWGPAEGVTSRVEHLEPGAKTIREPDIKKCHRHVMTVASRRTSVNEWPISPNPIIRVATDVEGPPSRPRGRDDGRITFPPRKHFDVPPTATSERQRHSSGPSGDDADAWISRQPSRVWEESRKASTFGVVVD